MPHGEDITLGVLHGLGWYYLLLFAMNAAAALVVLRRAPRETVATAVSTTGEATSAHAAVRPEYTRLAAAWGGVAAVFLALGALYLGGGGFALPGWFKAFVDGLADPVTYTFASVLGFTVVIVFRRFFASPVVAWAGLNFVLLLFGLSMTDWDFRQIVTKADNVPIVGMIFLVGFFTWLFLNRAVRNDVRIAAGRPTLEHEERQRVLVWPDLVYTELVAMVAVTVLLLLWAIPLKAPLEQPANALRTPNPSKAPWYFLGLQEMLVYFDPWLAGVVLPSIIIVGLMALPYIDFNKRGNGYYTFNERPFAITVFLFGFLVLWITLIVLGTFLRGPNWNFFGPYEYWNPHKVEALTNVNLSEYFWVHLLGGGLPDSPILRELPGIILVLAYMFLLPPLLGVTVFRSFMQRMGFIRYMVLAILLLSMASLPIKMLLRWVFNLKYVIAIPEIFFNI